MYFGSHWVRISTFSIICCTAAGCCLKGGVKISDLHITRRNEMYVSEVHPPPAAVSIPECLWIIIVPILPGWELVAAAAQMYGDTDRINSCIPHSNLHMCILVVISMVILYKKPCNIWNISNKNNDELCVSSLKTDTSQIYYCLDFHW